jgi:hypothetical protein
VGDGSVAGVEGVDVMDEVSGCCCEAALPDPGVVTEGTKVVILAGLVFEGLEGVVADCC